MNETIKLPSTRFLGSKAKLVGWIYENIKDIEFDNVLDAFGGTASFSYFMKIKGKRVFYNDVLKFNQDIAKAIIENNATKMDFSEAIGLFSPQKDMNYKHIIQSNFKGVYFKDAENKWLDIVIQNIMSKKSGYKKDILLASLYQACLIKRPFNLFHRNNLCIRTKNVERGFGNKTTWEKPFSKHFLRFVREYSGAVFDNGRKNKVIGGYDVLRIPNAKYDLVYLDPPYRSKTTRINYLNYYHFLEGLSNYNNWEKRIDFDSINKRMKSIPEIDRFIDHEYITTAFEKMLYRFRNSNIVMSYRNDGVPSISQIKKIFEETIGIKPIMRSKTYKYALSNGSTREFIFIHTNQ